MTTAVRETVRTAPQLIVEETAPRSKKTKRLARPVAGFDGEGMDIDGVHRYTLLTAYQGFANYQTYSIHDWRRGLSTERCITFLLGLPWAGQYRPISVSYSFGYDVTMIVRDLSDEQKTALHQSGWVVWQAPKSGRLFYIEYAPRHWFFVGEIGEEEAKYTVHPNEDVYNWNKKHPGKKWLRIDDTFGFYQSSFVKMLEAHKLCSAEMLEYIAREKAARGTFTKDERIEIERYNLAECALLVKYVKTLQMMCLGVGMKLPGWYGPGAMAGVLLQKHKAKDYVSDPEDEAMKGFVMRAASGGRIEEFMIGLIPTVRNGDINSAYPHKASMLPNLKGGEWQWRQRYTQEPYSLWEVDWKIPVRSAHLMPFPYRDAYGRVWYPSQGMGVVHQCELERALTRYSDCIRVRRGLVYSPDSPDTYPFAWIQELAALRLAYKAAGDARHIPLKLGMNSIPGKFWQHPITAGKTPPYQSFYAAGFVTAQTRAQVWDYIYSGGADASDVALIATDGVYSLEGRPAIPRGKGLGNWDDEKAWHDFLLLRTGVYVANPSSNTEPLRRTRGFGRVHLDYEGAASLWRGQCITGEYTYLERRFIGIGSCSGRGNFEQYAHWIDQERRLSFTPQKSIANPTESGILYLTPPAFPRDVPAKAYTPRPPQQDEPAYAQWAELRQWLDEMGDQP